MILSIKQQAVMQHLRRHGKLTKQEALAMPSLVKGIYHHPKARSRYVGNILSRMVKRGLIARTKPGVFVLARHSSAEQENLILK